jgi:pyruvate,orthophosphate dikinase
LTINGEKGKTVTLHENDWISLNGDTGEVLVGELKLKPQSIDASENVARFMQWVDERRNIRILANADTPADALEARNNGAQGIGLTRTEHMFFSEDRINIVRKFILGRSEDVRRESLNQLLPFQRHDFEGIFEAMDGLPVTVRLLDPPLHQFLPPEEKLTETFATDMGFSNLQECREAIDSLKESNPMLGLRGCRLGITNPALVEMQARALVEAALNNKYLKGLNPKLEIMIPLVSTSEEFKNQADLIRNTIEKVFEERVGQTVDYKLGTMIETPRAALVATDIANAGAEFFSYGTNDLTQMTYGFSRDDAGSFIPQYINKNILETDPFETIDQAGVGALITSSANAGREVANNLAKTNPRMANFTAGVCGEHGGETRSVRFFVHNGLDYVSCSPFRVPIARLAAAQAVIEQELEEKKTKPKYKSKISRRRRKLFIKERNLVSTMYKL